MAKKGSIAAVLFVLIVGIVGAVFLYGGGSSETGAMLLENGKVSPSPDFDDDDDGSPPTTVPDARFLGLCEYTCDATNKDTGKAKVFTRDFATDICCEVGQTEFVAQCPITKASVLLGFIAAIYAQWNIEATCDRSGGSCNGAGCLG